MILAPPLVQQRPDAVARDVPQQNSVFMPLQIRRRTGYSLGQQAP
jgi:hypothetical protein